MQWNPEVGTKVEHKRTEERGTIESCDNYYGWYVVKFDHGGKRMYTATDPSLVPWRVISTAEQRADTLLRLENAGITDNWYEY